MDLKTLVLMANLQFMMAVQKQFGLHWTAFPSRKFWWSRRSRSNRDSGDQGSAGAAFGCRAQTFFTKQPWCCHTPSVQKWSFLSGWTSTTCNPAFCDQLTYKGIGRYRRKNDPCSSTCLRAASHQECSLREKVDFVRVMSYNPIKPMQNLLSALRLIQIQELPQVRKSFLFI